VPKSYACANMRVHTQAARLDLPTPGWMRGPGSCLGSFALESAVDELAHKLNIDPLEFRILNHADVEPDTGREWSSKSLKACYEAAARRIGWFERNPAVGAMREGRYLVGFGMASSVYPARQLPAAARIILRADGRAVVQTAMHEIGQGAITAMTQVAADALGLPLQQVTFDFGDTALPYGGLTVGAMATLSNGAAIDQAGQRVRRALLKWAVRDRNSPFCGMKWRDLSIVEGRVVAPGGENEAVTDLLARHPEGEIEEEAITGRTVWWKRYGRQSFGAQFAKVLIDPDTMHIRVERLVGAFAGGRAINPLLVHSQCMGAMVWGLGQALMEESVVDGRTGLWVNRNLAEALVPTNADTDGIEAIIINEDDTRGHPLGVKGMGEIGVVGTAAAIGNAIFHATGTRLTSLPFRIDRLLTARS
jgi:xanthine dehydrogenase YagR molybdenum-binding subunit